MTTLDTLPVIIGAGQSMRPVPDDLHTAFGPVDLASEALDRAFTDAGMTSRTLSVCFGVRLFGDSGPVFPNPFGGSTNMPASVCARAGAAADRYVYDHVGGQSPQTLVAEAARMLMDGQADVVAIVGAEAIANIKAAGRAGAAPDWSDVRDEPLDDRGAYAPGPFMVSPQAIAHGIAAPVHYYALFETARRAALGETKEQYATRMASIWQDYAGVAANNDFASVRHAPRGDAIVTPSRDNPVISTPYTRAMVARDGVNLGAAVILTTFAHARDLGATDVTFLHAHDQCTEPTPLERARLDRADAQAAVLESVGRDADLYDLYSCFPIVPLEALRILRLDADVRTTLTGGLPFFGGPGNNYSLHGIAEAHRAVRGTDRTAVVYANGGLASKHAAGRYSGVPPKTVALHRSPDPAPSAAIVTDADPAGRIASYTVTHARGEPTGVLLIGETDAGARFYARGGIEDAGRFVQGDPLGETVRTQTRKGQNVMV